MIRELLIFLWGIALCVAVVLAALPGRADEHAPSQTMRRRATWLTTAFGLAGLPLLIACVASLPIGGPPNPLGLIAFVLLCALTGVAWAVLRGLWQRARYAAGAERRATGAPVGPVLDPAPQPHRGLSGQEAPPTRW